MPSVGDDDLAHILEVLLTDEERWGDPDKPAGIEVITPSRVNDAVWRSTLARMQRLTFSPPTARAYQRMVVYQDIRDVLPAVKVPTLVLHRQGDLMYPVDQGRWYAEHIAGAQFVELPGKITSRWRELSRTSRSSSLGSGDEPRPTHAQVNCRGCESFTRCRSPSAAWL